MGRRKLALKIPVGQDRIGQQALHPIDLLRHVIHAAIAVDDRVEMLRHGAPGVRDFGKGGRHLRQQHRPVQAQGRTSAAGNSFLENRNRLAVSGLPIRRVADGKPALVVARVVAEVLVKRRRRPPQPHQSAQTIALIRLRSRQRFVGKERFIAFPQPLP